MRTAFVLLGCLVFLGPLPGNGVSPAFAGEREERALKEADEELQGLIDDALDRGAKWLLGEQAADGSFGAEYGHPLGSTAISVLALLHARHPHTDPRLARAIEFMREVCTPLLKSGLRTYSASVTIMALVEYGRARGRTRGDFDLPEADRAWLSELVEFLVENRAFGGCWRYPGPGDGYDHSNTQYALLALKEARRAGLEVPEDLFVKVLGHFVGVQEKYGPKVRRYRETGGDGVYRADRETVSGYDHARGFAYVGSRPVTGSMTAAGVAAVSICISEVSEERWGTLIAAAEKAKFDGLAWLGRNFSVRENPGAGEVWHYYYLYGLERAGVLGGVVYMAGHRWYAEGATYLVDAQSPDGGWRVASRRGPGRVADPVTQSFALLFLSRATARALAVATEEPLLDLTNAAGLSDEDLAALFKTAYIELARLSGDEAAKRSREFAHLGPRVLPHLIRHLDAKGVEDRTRAVTILRAITGLAQGFEPDDEDGKRQAAMDRWTRWYLERRETLELDTTALRLR